MRLIDAGVVSGLRSQTTWHAIAEAMRPGAPPVLCLMTPRDAYVSIGYHRRLDEIDLDECARRGLAVYRRRVGGGPVYCDAGQLFFQLIAPAASFPAMMTKAWERAMGPAVEAFRALGAPAELVGGNDITAKGRKISGTGAARLGDAHVFVGNVIFSFDPDAMSACLRLPDGARAEAATLMRRFVASVDEVAAREVSRDEAARALSEAYAAAFGPATADGLTDDEQAVVERLDATFADPGWVAAERPPMPSRVKICAGVALLVLGDAWITVVDGRVERASLPGWLAAPGMRAELERAVVGLPLDAAALADAVARSGAAPDRRDRLVGAVMDAYRGGA